MHLLWFRNDLRLSWNSAVQYCANQPTIPVYIIDATVQPNTAQAIWLYKSLQSLNEALNNKLLVYLGKPEELFTQLAPNQIIVNERLTPEAIKLDASLSTLFPLKIIPNDNVIKNLHSPRTKNGHIYQVFSQFKLNYANYTIPPITQTAPPIWANAPNLITNWSQVQNRLFDKGAAWVKKLLPFIQAGEVQAQQTFYKFLPNINNYASNRDFPALNGTSKLGAHLALGEISILQIWHDLQTLTTSYNPLDKGGINIFRTELIWRDFSAYLLLHFPTTHKNPLQSKFTKFPWQQNQNHLKAWQYGKTGYPLVDAAMRQLWATGWQHNRLRMITASFLVKDLQINWTEGADWFMQTLFDADLANNTFGWQWSAGCGADAAPFFRIFNPTLQSERFDPNGQFIRTWVPEIAALPNKYIHAPHLSPKIELDKANIILGQTYPYPIVDHMQAKDQILKIFKQL